MTGDCAPGPSLLVARWRARAEELRLYAPQAAAAFEKAAEELQEYDQAHAAEALTLEQAAHESGYSVDHLARLVRKGQVPNAGRIRAPRIRRCDLPRKGIADPRPSDVVPPPLYSTSGTSIVGQIIREIHGR